MQIQKLEMHLMPLKMKSKILKGVSYANKQEDYQ